jgi:hypothetical protein
MAFGIENMFGLGTVADTATQVTSGSGAFFYIVYFSIYILIALFAFLIIRRFWLIKHVAFIIREQGGGKVVQKDFISIKKDKKTGNNLHRLLKARVEIAEPPSDAIYPLWKSKRTACFYNLDTQGNYIPCIAVSEQVIDENGEQKIVPIIRPIDREIRETYSQLLMQKMQRYKNPNFIDKYGSMILISSGLVAMVMIIIAAKM